MQHPPGPGPGIPPELLRIAVDSTRSGLTIAEVGVREMPLVYANRAFCDMTGYALDEVLGRDCRFLQAEFRADPEVQRLREAMAAREHATVLLRNRRKDGSLFLNELLVSPIVDDQGRLTHYVGVQHDVTAREQLRAEAVRLHEELRVQSTALEGLNEEMRSFSYSISHDLRAPLHAMLGFSTALREAQAGGRAERMSHYVDRIEANARQMDDLTQALLRLALVGEAPLVRTRCDLSAMAREVLDRHLAAAPPRAVRTVVEDGLWVDADAELLRVVLDNLLGNALKYSARTASPLVELGAEARAGSRRWFFVRDNGAGFDMAHAGRLFAPFQRLHGASEFKGTGIGLATVRRVVARHGGAIEARAAPGRGATFTFTLDA